MHIAAINSSTPYLHDLAIQNIISYFLALEANSRLIQLVCKVLLDSHKSPPNIVTNSNPLFGHHQNSKVSQINDIEHLTGTIYVIFSQK